MRMNIPNTLYQLKQAGLTQSFIASELECSQATISDMLNGKIGKVRPSYKTVSGLKRLSKKYIKKTTNVAEVKTEKPGISDN